MNLAHWVAVACDGCGVCRVLEHLVLRQLGRDDLSSDLMLLLLLQHHVERTHLSAGWSARGTGITRVLRIAAFVLEERDWVHLCPS